MIGPFAGHFPAHTFQWTVVIGCSLAAAVTDLRSRRIPNALTGPMFLAGLAWSLWSGGLAGLGDGVLAALALAAPYVLLFLIAGGGAADAKLMGALGAWLGIHEGTIVLLCVCASGAVLGLAYAILKGRARAVLSNLMLIVAALMSMLVGRQSWRDVAAQLPDARGMLCIPYGLAIFTGVCAAAAAALLANGGI